MNTNHELLINNLIPVMWESGAMGAFFMRFIENENFPANKGQWSNLEWFNWDRLLQYLEQGTEAMYYQRYINDHTYLLKEKYKDDDYHRAFIYVMYQLTEPQSKMGIDSFENLHPRSPDISAELLLELAEKEPLFDVARLKFKHLKAHYGSENKDVIKNLNWKTKLFCQFSNNKMWIADLLMYYKKFYFKIDKPETTIPMVIPNNTNWIKRLTDIGQRPAKKLPGYVNIDMYDLIFNNNIEQLQSVYPNFELTMAQRAMLEQVKQDIIYICNVFDLDHNISFVCQQDDARILHTSKIKDIVKKQDPQALFRYN